MVTENLEHALPPGFAPVLGPVLPPGCHLVELQFARPVPEHVLREALARMAFERILLDVASSTRSKHPSPSTKDDLPKDSLVPDLWLHWQEWGSPATHHEHSPHRYRFVATLLVPLQTCDTPAVQWIFSQAVPFDVYDETAQTESKAIGTTLERGKTYAMRFLTRMLSQPTRESVCEALALVGFRPSKIIMLKRNMRVPGLPSASVARWYGLGRWECEESSLTGEDPLFFEEMEEIVGG